MSPVKEGEGRRNPNPPPWASAALGAGARSAEKFQEMGRKCRTASRSGCSLTPPRLYAEKGGKSAYPVCTTNSIARLASQCRPRWPEHSPATCGAGHACDAQYRLPWYSSITFIVIGWSTSIPEGFKHPCIRFEMQGTGPSLETGWKHPRPHSSDRRFGNPFHPSFKKFLSPCSLESGYSSGGV